MKNKFIVNDILRQKAERILKERLPEVNSNLSESDMLKLIHELEVQYIELEMINNEIMDRDHENTDQSAELSEANRKASIQKGRYLNGQRN